MIYFGFVIVPVSNTNMRPGCTSCRAQAAAYALKLAGKAFLNCSAIPRPMMPTQLTVLTNASASAARISPVADLIMVLPLNNTSPCGLRLSGYAPYLASRRRFVAHHLSKEHRFVQQDATGRIVRPEIPPASLL